jgi:repressor of nif and glnA expression
MLEIYNKSHQNYGAPKITVELKKQGEKLSEKAVGNYMRQMGIKAKNNRECRAVRVNGVICQSD